MSCKVCGASNVIGMQGFIQPQKSGTHYFLVLTALFPKKVVPIMSTKKDLKWKGVVTSIRTVDGGRGFSFFFFFFLLFSPLFSLTSFVFCILFSYHPIFGPNRSIFWSLPHYFWSLPHYFLVLTALFPKKVVLIMSTKKVLDEALIYGIQIYSV